MIVHCIETSSLTLLRVQYTVSIMCKSPAGFALNISHIYRRSLDKAGLLPQISVYSSALWCLQTGENCRIWGFHGDVSFWSYINVSNAHGTSNFRTEVLLVFPPCCHLIVRVYYRFGGLFRLHFWVHTTRRLHSTATPQMEAECSSEMLVYSQETTRRNWEQLS